MHASTSTRYNASWRKRESEGAQAPRRSDGGRGRKMIAQELEVSLHMAFVEARQKRHEFITVDHLLLALLDNPTAAEALRACAVTTADLRTPLEDFTAGHTPTVAGPDEL